MGKLPIFFNAIFVTCRDIRSKVIKFFFFQLTPDTVSSAGQTGCHAVSSHSFLVLQNSRLV